MWLQSSVLQHHCRCLFSDWSEIRWVSQHGCFYVSSELTALFHVSVLLNFLSLFDVSWLVDYFQLITKLHRKLFYFRSFFSARMPLAG